MYTRGGTEADVNTKISKARAAFHSMVNMWKSMVISKPAKTHAFKTNVEPVLLNRAET